LDILLLGGGRIISHLQGNFHGVAELFGIAYRRNCCGVGRQFKSCLWPPGGRDAVGILFCRLGDDSSA
jgi:hypothetical protein